MSEDFGKEPKMLSEKGNIIVVEENNDDGVDNELRKSHKHASRSWDNYYTTLTEYKKRHGDCNVPYAYYPGGCLHDWVDKQRKNRSNLTQEQLKKLEEIEFDFLPSKDRSWENKWENKYSRLKSYRQKFGHCRIPRGYDDGQGVPGDLNNWIKNQRKIYTDRRMPQDRLERLEAINFIFRCGRPNEDQKWFQKYDRLRAYTKEFGNTAVPIPYKRDKSLTAWVSRMRTQNICGTLREDRKELLDELGMIWRVRRVNQGSTSTSESDEISVNPTKQKHARVPAISPHSSDLDYSTESEAQIAATKEIEDEQDGVDFDQMLSRLLVFKEQYGHVHLPPHYTFSGLGPWTMTMKRKARDGTLGDYEFRRLHSIGLVGRGEDEIWNDQYDRLEAYFRMYRHTRVSKLEDPGLARWVVVQRSMHKKGQLNSDRKAKLDAIGFLHSFRFVTKLIPEKPSVLSSTAPIDRRDELGDLVSNDTEQGCGLLAAASLWNAKT